MGRFAELVQRTIGLVADLRRLPESTYRFQFNAGFTFRDACRLVPYLADLGISHCYASPYLKARPGSTHGYDIIDHAILNPEIGTEEDFNALVAALKEHGLGQILDIVPNHMGVATNDNAWWNDVLENGPASRYAGFFDIAWQASPRPELQNKVLLPVLGEPYGDVLEAGKLRLEFAGGSFFIDYGDRRFPVAPCSYERILGHGLEELKKNLGPEDPALLECQSILTATRNLPNRTESDSARLAERWREKEIIKRRLAALIESSEPIRQFIKDTVAAFNGKPGEPRSFDRLDELLERQCYRLSFWRVASDEINYRRFFDNNELAALSMESPEVFEAAHALVLRLAAEGKIDGFRVDHVDGLYDPAEYLRRLQEHFVLACARRLVEAGPAMPESPWNDIVRPLREELAEAQTKMGEGQKRSPLYVVAEKILGAGEQLPETWELHGTSGYDFLNYVNGLFVDSRNSKAFTRTYSEISPEGTSFPAIAYRMKRLILNVSLAGELYMLTHQLDRLAQKTRKSRDYTFNTLRAAVGEVIACFPVYRSYISRQGIHEADRRYVELAVRRAEARNPLFSKRVFRFVRDMLLEPAPASFTVEDQSEQRRFAGKFQQVTAPVTAKGVEDTAFYIFNRLVSLNEVGGEPSRFGVSVEALHSYNQSRQARWPHALSPLSTHDTKRSEDVRARINVLSELPDEWQSRVARWSQLNEPHRLPVDDLVVPDANEEYLLYQTLVGAWPIELCTREEYQEFVGRIQAYMQKALHEAKVHTSWINPNEAYDKAIQEFVGHVLDEQSGKAFLDDFRAFQKRISCVGMFNSLSQTLLKIASPGVPDTYQGAELWDFSLVDPDNRRPVDYERRRGLLQELQKDEADGQDPRGLAKRLVDTREDSRIKLFVTYKALRCRRDLPGLFSSADYFPLAAKGKQADHLFAFARRLRNHWAIVAVPRLVAGLMPGRIEAPLGKAAWQDTRLELSELNAPAGQWSNVFTGERLAPSEATEAALLFQHFPVVLLRSD